MILVFGSQGQLGRALQDAIGEAPEHVFLSRDSRDYCGEITNTAGITETLMGLRPRIIINAAAYTAVDQAESEADAAFAVNGKAPEVMAQIAAKIGALLVHYSTDSVFDGSGDKAWKENDGCHPLSVYGKSKRAGEEAIIASGARHFILRTSWVYSSHGNNFLTTMLRLADSKPELRVINDQWGVPTHVDYLAAVTLDLINLATPGFGSSHPNPPDWGVYHCAANGETTWYEYAQLVINTAKSLGAAQACSSIIPVNATEYGSRTPRPLNSRLDTSKLTKFLRQKPPDWQDGVIQTVYQASKHSDHDVNA
jgi:dTDP-4-dehydrorhamnose reductase